MYVGREILYRFSECVLTVIKACSVAARFYFLSFMRMGTVMSFFLELQICNFCIAFAFPNINFEALDDDHIGRNIWCTSDLKLKINFKILSCSETAK
jgi:ABC-type uncharacterized transport system permease subunit